MTLLKTAYESASGLVWEEFWIIFLCNFRNLLYNKMCYYYYYYYYYDLFVHEKCVDGAKIGRVTA